VNSPSTRGGWRHLSPPGTLNRNNRSFREICIGGGVRQSEIIANSVKESGCESAGAGERDVDELPVNHCDLHVLRSRLPAAIAPFVVIGSTPSVGWTAILVAAPSQVWNSLRELPQVATGAGCLIVLAPGHNDLTSPAAMFFSSFSPIASWNVVSLLVLNKVLDTCCTGNSYLHKSHAACLPELE